MMHALIPSYGGIPLIYMGDEIALTNDYDYVRDPAHADDSRWLHRPKMDWARAEEAQRDSRSPAGRVLAGPLHILHRRGALGSLHILHRRAALGPLHILHRRAALGPLHGAHPTRVVDTGRRELFAFRREAPAGAMLCLFNFTEAWVRLHAGWARDQGVSRFFAALAEREVALDEDHLALAPYGRLWLVRDSKAMSVLDVAPMERNSPGPLLRLRRGTRASRRGGPGTRTKADSARSCCLRR